MSLIGIDKLLRKTRNLAQALDGGVFEEAGREWVEQDFVPEAKKVVHVDTGDIRDSIGGEVTNGTIRVFAASPDSIYEEEGTTTREGHPFMRPTLAKKRRSLTAKVRKKLKDQL